jgi:hypothetical protein
MTPAHTYNTGKHVGGKCSKSNGRSTTLSLTETNRTVCVMLSVERMDGYVENKINVFQTHTKMTMLFSGHVQLKYDIWQIQKQFSFVHLTMIFNL